MSGHSHDIQSLWASLGQYGARLKILLLAYGLVSTAMLAALEGIAGIDVLQLPVPWELPLLAATLVILAATAFMLLRASLRPETSQRYWFAPPGNSPGGPVRPVSLEGWAVLAVQLALVGAVVLVFTGPGDPEAAMSSMQLILLIFAWVTIPAYFLKTKPRGLAAGEEEKP